MKRLTLLLGALLLTAAALAQTAVPPTVRIAHGPYVLNVTEDGFTVVWDAKADAIGWVELAPMDGSHFYSAERPRYSRLASRTLPRRTHALGSDRRAPTRHDLPLPHHAAGNRPERGQPARHPRRRDGSEVYRRKPYTIRTLDPAQEKVDFWMVNDIHARDSVFQLLIKEAPECPAGLRLPESATWPARPRPSRRSGTPASGRHRRYSRPRASPSP